MKITLLYTYLSCLNCTFSQVPENFMIAITPLGSQLAFSEEFGQENSNERHRRARK